MISGKTFVDYPNFKVQFFVYTYAVIWAFVFYSVEPEHLAFRPDPAVPEHRIHDDSESQQNHTGRNSDFQKPNENGDMIEI